MKAKLVKALRELVDQVESGAATYTHDWDMYVDKWSIAAPSSNRFSTCDLKTPR